MIDIPHGRGVLRDPNLHKARAVSEKLEDRLATLADVIEVHKSSGDFSTIQNLDPAWRPEPITGTALEKMKTLELAAEDNERWSRISREEAACVKRIIVFSAPGTYTRPTKNDPFKDKPWARGMDRIRADRAARFGIVLAGKITNQDFSVFDALDPINANDPRLKGLQEKTRNAIRDTGIRLAYIADNAGARDMHQAMRQHTIFIPPENVDIINAVGEVGREDPEIKNTLDQAKATRDYLEGLRRGDSVVFVAHGPQLVRMEGMLKHQNAIPEGVDVFFEPLPIPDKKTLLWKQREIHSIGALAAQAGNLTIRYQEHVFVSERDSYCKASPTRYEATSGSRGARKIIK